MRTVPAPGGSLAETVDEQFLALICAEEELLRAEFEAIVAAEWPSPPAKTPGPAANAGRPRSWPPPGGPAGAGRLSGRPAHPGVDGWTRQRSPPRGQEPAGEARRPASPVRNDQDAFVEDEEVMKSARTHR